MPLHRRHDIPKDRLLNDEIYSPRASEIILPRYRMPEGEQSPRHAYELVHDELLLDGNSRQNLATFCQTWIEPEARQLMDESIDKNMVDKDEYPQTAEIEARCVHMLADLWNSPGGANTLGCSTTGSSEAATLAGIAAKWRWRKARQAQGKSADRPNLVTGPVQVCWHRFCRYLDVELREIPVERDRYLMTPDEVLKRVDENTIAVVPTLGVTFTLQYEPVDAVAKALDDLQKRTGLDIPIHVDAASGGFLAPFLTPSTVWDFRLPRVKSINASGHKFGLAPLGCGWVIWRDAADLPEELVFNVNYLGGNMSTFALNFSRPGGQVICQYYNFIRFGKTGYRRIQKACADVGAYLAREIAGIGLFEIIYGSHGGIPGVTWRFTDGVDPGFTLYDLADRLRTRGWQVPAYSLPPNARDVVVQRVLCRHDFSKDMANLLVDDIHRALDHFAAHPVQTPLSEKESGGFKHG